MQKLYLLFFCRTHRFTIGQDLSDGLWHQVGFSINNTQVQLVVDECMATHTSCSVKETHVSSAENPFVLLESSSLFIGGVPSISEILNHPGQVQLKK